MSDPSLRDVLIIPATEDDYEEVISISEGIYNGVDYLPFRYHSWLIDTQRKMFVAKSEGKVVGFESVLLVDGGLTAVVEGLRVAPWLRGHGVAGLLQQFCFATLRTEHPKVRYIRLTRAENPPPSMLMKYRLLHSKAVLTMILPANRKNEDLKLLENRVRSVCGGYPPQPSILNSSEVRNLFGELSEREGLFPKGLLIQGWLPLTTHKANLDLLLGRGLNWLYSHPNKVVGKCNDAKSDKDDAPNKSYNSFVHTSSTNASPSVSQNISSSLISPFLSSSTTVPPIIPSHGFLSLGTPPYLVPLGDKKYRFDIDMFGTDPLCAWNHVLHQLNQAVKSLPPGSDIVCFMYIEESLRSELASLLQGFTPFQLLREQLVLEMDI